MSSEGVQQFKAGFQDRPVPSRVPATTGSTMLWSLNESGAMETLIWANSDKSHLTDVDEPFHFAEEAGHRKYQMLTLFLFIYAFLELFNVISQNRTRALMIYNACHNKPLQRKTACITVDRESRFWNVL